MNSSNAEPVTVFAGQNTQQITFILDFDIKKGDFNFDSNVQLDDAIICLKVAAGLTPETNISIYADVDGDDRLSVADVLYILQIVSGLRDDTYR